MLATLAANADYGAAAHGLTGELLSGWPAVAFVGSVEIALGMVRRAREAQTVTVPTTVPLIHPVPVSEAVPELETVPDTATVPDAVPRSGGARACEAGRCRVPLRGRRRRGHAARCAPDQDRDRLRHAERTENSCTANSGCGGLKK